MSNIDTVIQQVIEKASRLGTGDKFSTDIKVVCSNYNPARDARDVEVVSVPLLVTVLYHGWYRIKAELGFDTRKFPPEKLAILKSLAERYGTELEVSDGRMALSVGGDRPHAQLQDLLLAYVAVDAAYRALTAGQAYA